MVAEEFVREDDIGRGQRSEIILSLANGLAQGRDADAMVVLTEVDFGARNYARMESLVDVATDW
jgi:hypothetical protein